MDVPEEANRLFEAGLGHFQNRQNDLAAKEFTKVLELCPTHVKARTYRALTRYRASDSYGVLSDILDLFAQGIVTKELLVLMANLMMENGSELWQRKAREAANSMGIPLDLLDGACESEEGLSCAAPDRVEYLRELRHRLEKIRDEVKADNEEPSTKRHERTEMDEGRVVSVATFRSRKKLGSVVGLDKAKQLIHDCIILPLEKPEVFTRYRKQHGLKLLLYGPPGCGKTLLVDALAGGIKATVVVARVHELIDMWVGNSEKNIHTIFKQAKETAKKTKKPVILFIDEIDGIGGKRDAQETRQWARLMINQLLTELDGLEKTEGLIVIGATNQPWAVDPALKRSGRFGNSIYVPPPDFEHRKKIFENYLKRLPVEKLDLDELAEVTEGYSGADIERLIDNALTKPMQRQDQTGREDNLRMDDVREVLNDKELGGNTLDEYYAMLEREIERDPRDKTIFRPLMEDLKKYLERKRSDNAPPPMAV